MLFQQSGPVPNGVVQLLGRPQNAPPSSQSAQFSFTLPPRRLEAFEDELSLGGREGIDLRVGADLGRILMDETDSIVSAAMAHGGRMDPGVPGSGRGVYSSAGPEGRHSFYDPRAHPHSRPSSTPLTNEVPVAVELLQRHLRDLLVQRLTVTEELPQSLSPPHTSPLPPSNPIAEDSEGMTDNTPGLLSLSDRDVSLTVPGGDSQAEMDTDMEAAAVAAGAAGTVEAVIEAAVAAQAVEEEPFEQYLINLMDQLSPPNAPPQDTRRLFSIPVPEPVTATLPVAVAASSPPPIAPTAEVTDLAVAEPLVLTAPPDPPAPATASSSLDLLTLDLTLIIDTIRETSNTSTDTGPVTADLGSSSLPIPRHDRIPESNNESEALESDGGEGLSSVEGHGIPLSYPSSSTVQREVALPASDDVITVTSPQTGGSSTSDPQTPGVIPLNLDPQLEGGAATEVEVEVEGGSEAAVAVVEGAEGGGEGGGGGARAIACPAGYEPDVFYSLPEFMQQEVADQHQEVGGSDQTRALVEVRIRPNDLL